MNHAMYKHILKKKGMTLKDLAEKLSVSRPTIYRILERYDSGAGLDEPYLSELDSIFLGERNHMYESRNGNLVVRLIENTGENANGTFIKGSETRGKRDIVVGSVVVPNPNYAIGTEIYFPFYAGQPFELDGKQAFIVDGRDVKLIRKGE